MNGWRAAAGTRRGLGLLLGSLATSLAELIEGEEAAARKRRKKKRKKKNEPRCPTGVVTCNNTCCKPGQSCLGPVFGCANGDIEVGEPCDPDIPAACKSGNCGCNGVECTCRFEECRATNMSCLVDNECCSGFCFIGSHCKEDAGPTDP